MLVVSPIVNMIRTTKREMSVCVCASWKRINQATTKNYKKPLKTKHQKKRQLILPSPTKHPWKPCFFWGDLHIFRTIEWGCSIWTADGSTSIFDTEALLMVISPYDPCKIPMVLSIEILVKYKHIYKSWYTFIYMYHIIYLFNSQTSQSRFLSGCLRAAVMPNVSRALSSPKKPGCCSANWTIRWDIAS